MKDRRNWKTWLLPIIVAAGLSAVLAFTASSVKVGVHLENESIHKDVEILDQRYMPREVLDEKLNNMQQTLDRIELKMGN